MSDKVDLPVRIGQSTIYTMALVDDENIEQDIDYMETVSLRAREHAYSEDVLFEITDQDFIEITSATGIISIEFNAETVGYIQDYAKVHYDLTYTCTEASDPISLMSGDLCVQFGEE